MLNDAYKNPLRRIYIPLYKFAEPEKSLDELNPAIELQRRQQTDSTIVRIMKSRKTMKHVELISEVVQQLCIRFKPQPPEIKKRIEALIEQEYLKRSEENRSTYEYLA